MQLPNGTPTSTRKVREKDYVETGYNDGLFVFPAPFVATDFSDVAGRLGVKADGMALKFNAWLGADLAALLAAQVKKVLAFNEELAAAQAKGERTDESFKDLPGTEELSLIISEYDFAAREPTEKLSPLDREIHRRGKDLVRNLLKAYGLPEDSLPAPVTIAKSEEKISEGQIGPARFDELVGYFASGTGKWAGGKPAKVRANIIAEAKKAIRATEASDDLADVFSSTSDQEEAA
jgi:hypothetical protein